MLTLTRKIGESIRIGDDISIIIKEVKGRQVRIGIVAPRDIYVCREELYLKIQEANIAATQAASSPVERGEKNLSAAGSFLLSQIGAFSSPLNKINSSNSKSLSSQSQKKIKHNLDSSPAETSVSQPSQEVRDED